MRLRKISEEFENVFPIDNIASKEHVIETTKAAIEFSKQIEGSQNPEDHLEAQRAHEKAASANRRMKENTAFEQDVHRMHQYGQLERYHMKQATHHAKLAQQLKRATGSLDLASY